MYFFTRELCRDGMMEKILYL